MDILLLEEMVLEEMVFAVEGDGGYCCCDAP